MEQQLEDGSPGYTIFLMEIQRMFIHLDFQEEQSCVQTILELK